MSCDSIDFAMYLMDSIRCAQIARKEQTMNFWKNRDSQGEWRWSLHADNGDIVAISGEGYKREEGCDHAIDIVKRFAAIASVRRDIVSARLPITTARLRLRGE